MRANQASHQSANAFPMMHNKTMANSVNSLGGVGQVQASPGTYGNSYSSNPSYPIGNSFPANSIGSITMHAAIKAIQEQRQQLESTSCSSSQRHVLHNQPRQQQQQSVQWAEEPKPNSSNLKLNEGTTVEESKTVIGFSVTNETKVKEISNINRKDK